MKIVKRGNITYYIKTEAVIVGINDFQHIAYTIYALQNRKPFYDFRREIINSGQGDFTTVTDIIELGQKYGLKAVGSQKPKIEETK